MIEKVTFAIPARAGSRRLPLKNFKKLGGYPLVAWSAWFAATIMPSSRIILSTDFSPLLQFDHRVPNLEIVGRSEHVSSSEASTEDWLRALIAEQNVESEVVALLQPTSPFREAATFRRLLESFDQVRTVNSVFSGRRGLPNGNLYLARRSSLFSGQSLSSAEKVTNWVEPTYSWEDIDIDEVSDWDKAEKALQQPVIREMVTELSESIVGQSFVNFGTQPESHS